MYIHEVRLELSIISFHSIQITNCRFDNSSSQTQRKKKLLTTQVRNCRFVKKEKKNVQYK